MNTNPRGLLGGLRSWLGGGQSAPSLMPAPLQPSSGYMRDNRNVTMASWNPPLREFQEDVSAALNSSAARTIDLIQNGGWIAGMVDQAVANTVGTGLRLLPKPENSLFGMSDADARKWAKIVGARWEAYCNSPQECDAEGMRTHGQLQAVAFRGWLATGEILAEFPIIRRNWCRYGSKIKVIPSYRLSRQTDPSRRLVNGVFQDATGMPVAYLARRRDPILGMVDYTVRARDDFGRTNALLSFDGMPGTYRGIGPLVPALQVARQFDQLADATLMAAIVKQLFAITITGDAPTKEIIEGMLTAQEMAKMERQGVGALETYMDSMLSYYDGSTINVGINGRIAHMFPGQELKFESAQSPGSDYRDYSKQLLREICRCLGMTYSSGTGDFEGASYNSERSGNTSIYEVTMQRRNFVVAPVCQASYENWLEEEILTGGIPFPGGYEAFLANKVAACRASWRGSPRPEADPLKAAKAVEIYKRIGVMSDEMIAADLGVDIEDVYAARANEKALRAEYGLPDDQMMPATGGAPVKGGGDGDDDEEERD